ncbi:hypothetical protein OIU77_025290 [Salix suchowensis]|uniref:MLO-like protein n=1 Tax=Salix suchowensis TaxID=1278906 RepID=A0ABQ9BVQ6_9ROSI|nr:hypothetical protein OIU77_025290 [Salix suchowensis]
MDTDRCKMASSRELIGYEKLISVDGLHQLHILIFFLAFFHVLFSAITMTLVKLKSRAWKRWELETLSHGYEFSNEFLSSFMLDAFSDNFSSVSRSDYLTLHNGFITVHLAPGSKFNFQKYIKRSLEDDFKLVVGVGPVLWACFIIFLLLNVNGLQALFWASIIPVIYSFGLKSCFHDNFDLVIAKVALGVGALILCSYITLPLYALVTQMGSRMKKSVFDEQTSKALKRWHMLVKKRHVKGGKTPTRTLGSVSPSVSTVSSAHPLQ